MNASRGADERSNDERDDLTEWACDEDAQESWTRCDNCRKWRRDLRPEIERSNDHLLVTCADFGLTCRDPQQPLPGDWEAAQSEPDDTSRDGRCDRPEHHDERDSTTAIPSLVDVPTFWVVDHDDRTKAPARMGNSELRETRMDLRSLIDAYDPARADSEQGPLRDFLEDLLVRTHRSHATHLVLFECSLTRIHPTRRLCCLFIPYAYIDRVSSYSELLVNVVCL